MNGGHTRRCVGRFRWPIARWEALTLYFMKNKFIFDILFSKKHFSKYFEKIYPQICEILDSEILNLSMKLFPKIYLLNFSKMKFQIKSCFSWSRELGLLNALLVIEIDRHIAEYGPIQKKVDIFSQISRFTVG